MVIKKGDFVEIEYTGSLKEDGTIFDTSDGKKAEELGIKNPDMEYGPITICVGEGQLVKGLDDFIEGKEIGKEYKIELTPDQSFGKKDAKLIQLISISKFKKQGIAPVPGLQVNIDGVMGIVKSVSGGRVLVDFNHPLSGRDVVYDIKVNKTVTDPALKLKSYLKLGLNMKDVDVELKEGNAEVKLKVEIPPPIAEQLGKKISELIPEIKKTEFKKL